MCVFYFNYIMSKYDNEHLVNFKNNFCHENEYYYYNFDNFPFHLLKNLLKQIIHASHNQ